MTDILPELKRADQRIIPVDHSEIRLFTVVRDEELRLPNFLTHYRQLGVQRFFVINNKSRDNTRDYVLAQPDCHLFDTNASFLTSQSGVKWLNSLLGVYGTGHWIVYADADELLVYPHYEHHKLPELCDWMDQHGYQGIYSLMLDMYSDQSLGQISYAKGGSLLAACPWLDRHYVFVPRLSLSFGKRPFPEFEPIGGPRLRLCYPNQNTNRLWPRLQAKLRYRYNKLAHRLCWPQLPGERPATQAFKLPLIKWQQDYGYITSHRLNPVALAPVTGAVLHFKYLQDFTTKVQHALQTKEHYDCSSEYAIYAQLLADNPSLTFMYEGSQFYRDSQQLVDLCLIKDDADWVSYARAQADA